MKKQNLIKAIFLSGILQLLIVDTASAQWQSLFNGKDLTGWNQKNGAAKYTVENGEIVGTTVANTPNSFLCTNAEYGDFIFEVDLKVENTMNSGIQFRSLSKPDYQNNRVHGYQMEVDPTDRAWSGGIYDEARRDWLYIPNINPETKKAFKKGSWNRFRIEAIGNTIRTWINNIPVAHLIDDMTAKGFIALQVHSIYGDMKEGMKIRWKNINIQTTNLKTAPLDDIVVVNLLPNNLSAQEKKNGVQLLFDGKTTDGWRRIYQEKFPEKGWQVKNGELSVLGTEAGQTATGNDIITQKQYGAFIFQFDFKLTEGANSGVKYFVTETYDGAAIGPEFQILDDEKHPDAKMGSIGNRTLASLYDLIPSLPEKRARKKIGEWNRGMIIAYADGNVEHFLNGWKLVEYKRGTPYFNALVARSKYEKLPNFGLAPAGHLLLQDHGNLVSYRNLKIQEIKKTTMTK